MLYPLHFMPARVPAPIVKRIRCGLNQVLENELWRRPRSDMGRLGDGDDVLGVD